MKYTDAILADNPRSTLDEPTTPAERDEMFVRARDMPEPYFSRCVLRLLLENERLREAPEGEAERLRERLAEVERERDALKMQLDAVRAVASEEAATAVLRSIVEQS